MKYSLKCSKWNFESTWFFKIEKYQEILTLSIKIAKSLMHIRIENYVLLVKLAYFTSTVGWKLLYNCHFY